jgi:hypothetical protein
MNLPVEMTSTFLQPLNPTVDKGFHNLSLLKNSLPTGVLLWRLDV